MNSDPVSIRIFLPTGRADGLRIAEIINWSGKALACPRSQLKDLLSREEVQGPGVYLLTGVDPDSGQGAIYVGEAEAIGSRLRSHQDKDFWVQAVVFVSKDENLTKAHAKFIEGDLIRRGTELGRAQILNSQGSGAKLPEADAADMHGYLRRMYQLLPILGINVFEALEGVAEPSLLECRIKGLLARGRRTASGFLVLKGSQAVAAHRPSAARVRIVRDELKEMGVLVPESEYLVFSRDFEFSSPSAAASVIRGGSSNGLTNWKTHSGVALKDVEATDQG